MTINDNSTKSINAAIIDLQNQIKQLQYKIDILNKNQLKEDDIEFPGKVDMPMKLVKQKKQTTLKQQILQNILLKQKMRFTLELRIMQQKQRKMEMVM